VFTLKKKVPLAASSHRDKGKRDHEYSQTAEATPRKQLNLRASKEPSWLCGGGGQKLALPARARRNPTGGGGPNKPDSMGGTWLLTEKQKGEGETAPAPKRKMTASYPEINSSPGEHKGCWRRSRKGRSALPPQGIMDSVFCRR